MAAFKAGAGEIGNFVLRVAQRRQLFHGGKIKIRSRVVAGQRLPRALAEHRVRLDLQQIAADVGAAALRQQGDGFVQLGPWYKRAAQASGRR